MGTSVSTPEPRSYSQETRDTLQAQLDLAPAKFASEAQFGPQYQQLQLDMFRQALPQLLGAYQHEIMPALTQAEITSRGASRAGDIADVARLGPLARQAQAAGAPGEAALVDSMVADAQTGLAAGTNLTPEEQRAAQQQSRAAFAARGLGTTPSGAIDEIVRMQAGGQQAKLRRQAQAGQALGLSQQFYGDPFQQTLGRPSQAFSMSPGLAGQAQGFNPGMLFNPESQYAADINNQGWQGALAARTASAANRSALIGAGISAAGSAASSL
jgi:hypothetical protein